MMADIPGQCRAAVKFAAFLLAIIILMPFQVTWLLMIAVIPTIHQSPVVRLWFYLITKLIGVRVSVIGKDNLQPGQKIILSNHISYLDILIFGYMFDAFFVAKSDIADWPVFGFLSKISSVVFISRKPLEVKKQIVHLQNHLRLKKSLMIFAEGTTSNGREVLPFKTGFLNSLIDLTDMPTLQPVTLTYTRLNDKSLMAPEDSDQIAWYVGSIELGPHLWNMFKQKSVTVKIQIHPPLAASQPVEPKKIAQEAFSIVASGFSAHWAEALQGYSHSGRE